MENKLIYIVDDEINLTKLIYYWISEKWGYKARIFHSGEDFLNNLDTDPDCILLDIMLPGLSGVELLKIVKNKNENLPVIMLSAQGSIDIALETIKLGAYDYLPKPIDMQKLQVTIKNAITNYDLVREIDLLKEEKSRRYSFDNIIAIDDTMQEVFRLMQKVLNNSINVLIYGASGTGKELIARAIHFNSNRKDKPFVVINCASIPRELLESEFFGHEKGSFTGAFAKKIGKFEVAADGTIFLDEIGELELSLQAKLLRVLQEKTYERVGGNEELKTDARIISATNKNLLKCVQDKTFREDLYYRLSSFPISVPLLKDRKSDILLLAEYFIKTYAKNNNLSIPIISKKVMNILLEYPWPGNVRELENCMQRAVIMCDGTKIQLKDLPLSLQSFVSEIGHYEELMTTKNNEILPFEAVERQTIERAIKLCDGNLQIAANKLQIGTSTIYRLVKKYKIQTKKI